MNTGLTKYQNCKSKYGFLVVLNVINTTVKHSHLADEGKSLLLLLFLHLTLVCYHMYLYISISMTGVKAIKCIE